MSETQTTMTTNPAVLKQGESFIRTYGKYSNLIKDADGNIALRHYYPHDDPHTFWRAVKAVQATQVSSRHPNGLTVFIASKHKNKDIEIDVEYADAGPLNKFIRLLREKFIELDNKIKKATVEKDMTSLNKLLNEKNEAKLHQIQMAKSVARQLLDYCFYLDTVIDKVHKNLNSHTVLFRRDGCVKATFFDYLDKNYIKANRFHFLQFNAYIAPEVISKKFNEVLMEIAKKDDPIRKDIEVEYFTKKVMEDFLKATNDSLTSDAINRINSPNSKSDIWSIGAILYSIMTCTDFMPTWDYKEPDFEDYPPVNAHNIYKFLCAKKAESSNWTEEDDKVLENARKLCLLEDEAEEKRKKEEIIHVQKYKNFINFIVGSNDKEWSDKFGNDPYLTHIARRCLDLNEKTRANIGELNALIYLMGGYVLADVTQPYRNEDERAALTPITTGREYEKLKDDPEGQKYKFKRNWNEVWDAFSTDCAALSRPIMYDKKAAQRAMEDDGLVPKTLNENIVWPTPINTLPRVDILDEEIYGEGILRELKYFFDTRFGKIYNRVYRRDPTFTEKMIIRNTNFPPDDLIDPDKTTFVNIEYGDGFVVKHMIWAFIDKNKLERTMRIRDISLYLELESRTFRKRRFMLGESLTKCEKKRRELTRKRQVCAWIAQARACAFFTEGYTLM